MKTLLALDIGTTAVKAALFSEDLRMLSLAIHEYTLETPATDIVELAPQVYLDNIALSVQEALKQAGASPRDISCISCATQGETLIPVDADGNTLHNAIVWLDARAVEESAFIGARYSNERFYRKTGLPEITAYYPLAKLLWLRNHRPEIYRAAHKFLLLEDFVIARLTGRFCTNPALMCSTGYYDITEGALWREMLDACGLSADKIPEVIPCGSIAGHLSASGAALLGLPEGIPVAAGAMDQVAAAVGSGNVDTGIVAETTGTAHVITATADSPGTEFWSPITVYCHALPGQYLRVTVNPTAGIIYKWFRTEFCRELPERTAFREMDELAAQVPPGSRGLILSPHLTGRQFPQADTDARGVFFGVGMDTGRDCFIRSILESVGYLLRESLEIMGPLPSLLYALGGGAKSPLWNQIKADICNLEIHTLVTEEAALQGAAILGGVAVGLYPGVGEMARRIGVRQTYRPNPENRAVYNTAYQKYLKMGERFHPLFHANR